MKNFTHPALRSWLKLFLKVIVCTLWLLCIVSAAISRDLRLPHLGQNPGDQTVCAGSSPVFSIGTVTGTSGTTTIQWEVSVNGGGSYSTVSNGVSYSGATTASLTVLNVSTALNGNRYRCVVTDATGSTVSNAALLSVNATPAVSSATRTTTVCEGATGAGLQVTNDPALSYQWQVSSNNGGSWNNVNAGDGYTGGTTNDLTYPAASLSMNGYLFRYTASNSVTTCNATSIALDTLRVLSKPVFTGGTVSPLSATICPNGNTVFTANPTGAAAMAYQWQVRQVLPTSGVFANVSDDAVYSGAQTKTLNITAFTGAAGSSWQVQLVASYPSTLGCASSSLGAIIIRTLPSVAVQPKDTTVCANSPAGFKVTGSGSATLTYQWQTDNGTAGVSWSNTASIGTVPTILELGPVTTAMNGFRYRVTVSNSCTPPATSAERVLTVRRSGTWLGYKDTKWEEPMNWCGGIPDRTIDVLVPNWPSNMPNISDGTGTALFKSLEIENAARLTISGGAVENMTGPFNLQGTVIYSALREQTVFPADHGSLEINGTGNKSLSSPVAISHNLVLGGSAKLVTRTNILTMKTGSNPVVTSAFNDPATSWIVTGNGNAGAANTGIGGLRIEQVDAADGAVLFPVGPTPTAYNPLQLTNGGTVDHFTVAVNDQTIPGGIYAAGVNRTWLVSEAVVGGSNVMLSLKWQGNEEQSLFDRIQTQIIRSNGSQIVESSAKAPASGGDPYARADGAFATLTQFSVASSAVVLAVQLSSFTVQRSGNGAVGLAWNTTGISLPEYFDVQRSADGVHFVTIGRVEGERDKTAYNFTDNVPGTGIVYYRLLMMDLQNEMVASSIRSVVLNSNNLAQLRPSATAGTITKVYIQSSKQTVASLYVTDIAGRIHLRQSVSVNKGENLLPLWIGDLGKGVYYVHVKSGDGNSQVLTLMKQ
ncbi:MULTISPECIES: T9SS type A sorting domain-containing protein [Niastella]|uniref:T9SS type A sorting domain-containing protein n=1 Tax=Niastella soli TaxID=2821487 RepID=A0ABS3YMC1_9BACT|nr:T9SS type A sorting domain-containing protein [Niastella soli]MBO9198747.1 T9SS type A sorting domain-containing protein [Niastella soli]